jgi:hypothetical protein
MGDNDSYAFGLRDDTISRADERSTCALCGAVRLWNVDGCTYCARKATRRLIALALFVLALTLAAFGAAYHVTTQPEPPRLLLPGGLPSLDLDDAADDWRAHFLQAECERCPECCGQ